MIPGIEDIVAGLLAGDYTAQQAIGWLNQHIELARDNGDKDALLDHFAGLAMQGFCANPAVFASNPTSGWGLVNCKDEELIGYCRRLADIMIAERSKS